MTPGAFRFLLATLVVVHHSFPPRLGCISVGMFFVLSGYWIARMWQQKYSKHQYPYISFLMGRWWRLAPLFIVVHLLAVVYVGLGGSGNTNAVSNWKWWATQPLIAGSSQFDRLLPPSWSLDLEMQFYVVSVFLITGVMQFAFRECACLLAALFAWGCLMLVSGSTTETARLDVFMWLFLAGTMAHRFHWKPSIVAQWTSVVAVVVLISAMIALPQTRELVWRSGISSAGSNAFSSMIFFAGMCLVSIPLTLGTVCRNSGSWDRWLGDLSYPLYLFHWIPREWYYSNVDWSKPAWQNGVLLLANFGMAVLGAVALLHMVDRPVQLWHNQCLSRKTCRSMRITELVQSNADSP